MKLYLAIALLVVAFAALTAAQEKTVEEKFQEFGTQVTEGFNQFAEKVKETFSGAQASDFATKTQDFFTGLFEQAKALGQ